jgi:hypothetical protein
MDRAPRLPRAWFAMLPGDSWTLQPRGARVHLMQPAPDNATLSLPQLRDLARGNRWRVVFAGAEHLAVLEAEADPGKVISRNVDREAIVHLRALKAAGRPFEVSA